MPRVIDEKCIKCGSCADTCPTSCISEGDKIFVINPDECIDCGACEEVCPTDAISEE